MKFTGERVVPDDMVERPDIYSEHLVRYAIALKYCSLNDVLDIACGTGYGTALLGSVSNSIAGGDHDVPTLDYAREKYNLDFKKIDIDHQTIASVFKKKFHVIVSFETIEHISYPQKFIKSVKESLLKHGLFIFSIPVQNRSAYHRHLYTFKDAEKFGNNLFKPIKTFVQKADMILHPLMASGDFDCHGTYIIKVMSKNGH